MQLAQKFESRSHSLGRPCRYRCRQFGIVGRSAQAVLARCKNRRIRKLHCTNEASFVHLAISLRGSAHGHQGSRLERCGGRSQLFALVPEHLFASRRQDGSSSAMTVEKRWSLSLPRKLWREKYRFMPGHPEGEEEFPRFQCVQTFEEPCQRSNLMHDVSHIALGYPQHPPLTDDGCPNFDPVLEAEAKELSCTLLIPKPAARKIVAEGLTLAKASIIYGASRDLIEYRIRITDAHVWYRNRLRYS